MRPRRRIIGPVLELGWLLGTGGLFVFDYDCLRLFALACAIHRYAMAAEILQQMKFSDSRVHRMHVTEV